MYKRAVLLSVVTITYNFAEGIIATIFGAHDETLALFGFGVDSFVEVLSGIGIAHMVWRMQRHPVEERDKFEVTALKITGTAFYALVVGLVVGAAIALVQGTTPKTTMVGIVISTISILTMYVLYKKKLEVGKALNSEPIISDANCTKTCFYLSFILLASSAVYELFRIPYIDAVGSLGIAWYALKEGKEAFQKAKTRSVSCADNCC